MTIDRMFQDNMVLQMEKPVKIWGTAEDSATVTVTFNGQTVTTRPEDGRWDITLQPMDAARGLSMYVNDGTDTITLQNIAIGEVWLAGGQSNMEFYMEYDADYLTEKAGTLHLDIRFFDYPEVSYPQQEDDWNYDEMGIWRQADPNNLRWCSAVAYWCAKKLHVDLGVPVGIIGCNWGGTNAGCWMDPKYLAKHGQCWLDQYQADLKNIPDPKAWFEEWRKNPENNRGKPFENQFDLKFMPGVSREDQLKFMAGSGAEWGKPQPVGPGHFMWPGALYENMLCHVAPFTIRGALWYQGCSDESHAAEYAGVLSDLIDNWRTLWNDQFPFIIAQLAPFSAWLTCEGTNYPVVRQSQQTVADTVPNTYLISTGDVGMEYDIHPKQKKPVGERAALLAERYVYGCDVPADAPRLSAISKAPGMVMLHFENVGEGLWMKGSTIDGLELFAGSEPVEINATTAGGNLVILLTGDADRVDTVSFAHKPFYTMNLYNSYGVPALPALVHIGE